MPVIIHLSVFVYSSVKGISVRFEKNEIAFKARKECEWGKRVSSSSYKMRLLLKIQINAFILTLAMAAYN